MAENVSGTDDETEDEQQSRSTGRQPAPKSAAKPARKPTQKPTERPAEKPARGDETMQRSSDGRERRRDGDGARPRINGRQAARLAALELADLTGKEFEGVVGIRKVDGEWHVEIEVLEMERVPSTTDVLGLYDVSLDASGDLVGYERTARYVRSETEKDR